MATSVLARLQEWYRSQCDDDWEHSHGVKLETLDNPGWMLTVDLTDTSWAHLTAPRTVLERSETDWIQSEIADGKFLACGGAGNLEEVLESFFERIASEGIPAFSELSLEPGPLDPGSTCDCCGVTSTTVHGFVSWREDAFAVYFAGWSEHHPDRGVTLAIATGEWSDDADAQARTCIGLEASAAGDEIHFAVVGPEHSPWAETRLFGKMLPRERSMASPAWQPTLKVAELIVRQDPRVRAALERGGASCPPT